MEEVRLAIKDSVRAARHLVGNAAVVVPLIPKPVTRVADTLLTRTESAVRVLSGRTGGPEALVASWSPLMGRHPREVRRGALRSAVRRTMARSVASTDGMAIFVSEAAVARALAAVDLDAADASLVATDIALALVDAIPVRTFGLPFAALPTGDLVRRPALIAGLAVLVAARTHDPSLAGLVVEACTLAIDACMDSASAALASPDPRSSLGELYGTLAPHLP